MATKPEPWLRLYTETVRDRKLRREKPETRWLWIAVLCLARSSPEHGRLLLSDGQERPRLAEWTPPAVEVADPAVARAALAAARGRSEVVPS